MRTLAALLLLSGSIIANAQQADRDRRLKEMERKLEEATRQLDQVNGVIQALRAEMSRLKGEEIEGDGPAGSPVAAPAQRPVASGQPPSDRAARFIEQVIGPGVGSDERENQLSARPEIFIQARYSAAPIRDAGSEFEPNIGLTRIETRWAGKISARLGAGLEIQYHPAIDGSPEELVNDAFIESYLNDHLTLRAGQFIKPFGFDIQQSSALRESPERGMFAGYFFPGQRDRGFVVSGDLGSLGGAGKKLYYYIGAFNGNRFFADNNRQLNYVARVRKIFDWPHLALGVSAQLGKQLLPGGVSGDRAENVFGFDFQYAAGRFGLRGEFAAGNTPSTLLSIEPGFAPAFRPGAHSSGGHLFATYEISAADNVYARYDQFNGDPVTGRNIRAFNFGYLRRMGEFSRLGFDYQLKNRPSFNDDAVNGRFHIKWGIEF
ncbi:MAG TPA: hypothetical protein VJH03_13275 [Blastocatellia bacterium]|nr:hypothetical protein [Blastocatellia bacterium]